MRSKSLLKCVFTYIHIWGITIQHCKVKSLELICTIKAWLTAAVLEEGLPETDYIKRRSGSNMVNLTKITAVNIMFSEAPLDPTFFIVILQLLYNKSAHLAVLYHLEMIQYFSQATKGTFVSEKLLKLFGLHLQFNFFPAPQFPLSDALWSEECTPTTQHQNMIVRVFILFFKICLYTQNSCSELECSVVKLRVWSWRITVFRRES